MKVVPISEGVLISEIPLCLPVKNIAICCGRYIQVLNVMTVQMFCKDITCLYSCAQVHTDRNQAFPLNSTKFLAPVSPPLKLPEPLSPPPPAKEVKMPLKTDSALVVSRAVCGVLLFVFVFLLHQLHVKKLFSSFLWTLHVDYIILHPLQYRILLLLGACACIPTARLGKGANST